MTFEKIALHLLILSLTVWPDYYCLMRLTGRCLEDRILTESTMKGAPCSSSSITVLVLPEAAALPPPGVADPGGSANPDEDVAVPDHREEGAMAEGKAANPILAAEPG